MAIATSVAKAAIERSLVRESFYDFVQRFWGEIISEDPVWNWHIEYICGELQKVAERVFRRQPKEYDLIVNVPPGSTKSTVASVMFPVWAWTRDKTIRTICGSYAFPLSLHLASMSRRILASDKFRELFPDLALVEEGKGYMVNEGGGSRFATTVAGSVTGMHGHFQIIDDPINPREALSGAMLRAANDWFDHTLPSRVISKKVTPLILIMQRLHEDDPTGHIIEKRREGALRHISLPVELSEDVRPRSLRRQYVDGLFDPVRLSRDVLTDLQSELGLYSYAGQYMQRPVPAGQSMFRTTQIRIVDRPPTTLAAMVRYWDKAGTAKAGCYTVGVKMARDTAGGYGILDVRRGQWEAYERERVMKQTTILDGMGCVVGIEQEPGSGGKESAQASVRNLAGYRVRLDRPHGDKVLRADPFAVQVNAGNVWVLRGEWNTAYLHELGFFPNGKFKDQVDGSSGAFSMVTKVRRAVGALV